MSNSQVGESRFKWSPRVRRLQRHAKIIASVMLLLAQVEARRLDKDLVEATFLDLDLVEGECLSQILVEAARLGLILVEACLG
ncbi:UNVERIFIED_CONTAM: hypothetical protein Sradi_5076400 [Sesamum radiatum]|uniref:Uncharacterized protein n=1 Tax=Sesamum radiatum TaxID=300843 RepID=A0AAW2M3L5_SESRA